MTFRHLSVTFTCTIFGGTLHFKFTLGSQKNNSLFLNIDGRRTALGLCLLDICKKINIYIYIYIYIYPFMRRHTKQHPRHLREQTRLEGMNHLKVNIIGESCSVCR